jgi:hypothetical protein
VKLLLVLFLLAFGLPPLICAQESAGEPSEHQHHQHHMDHSQHADHSMEMDMAGMVMHANSDRLPWGCPVVSEDVKITVRAGQKYARQFNGTMFTYDQREWRVPPCARVQVTLINEDSVRHQWMIHELPRYLYPQGMFHLEANGGQQKSGVFIVPSGDKTYLVHCDIAQHTEKGMKAQLQVGGGDGDLPSIPGITGPRHADAYPVRWSMWTYAVLLVVSGLGTALTTKGLGRLCGGRNPDS